MALDDFLAAYESDRTAWQRLPFVEQQAMFDAAVSKIHAADAAIRLCDPEHITPVGKRIIRLALGTVARSH